MWKKFIPFMSDEAIKYHTMKDQIYDSLFNRESLIDDIMKRIDIEIKDKASKSLSGLESILGRLLDK